MPFDKPEPPKIPDLPPTNPPLVEQVDQVDQTPSFLEGLTRKEQIDLIIKRKKELERRRGIINGIIKSNYSLFKELHPKMPRFERQRLVQQKSNKLIAERNDINKALDDIIGLLESLDVHPSELGTD